MSVEDCEVVVTRGGARAMLDRRVGEVMHPVVGPAIEATRLYIGPSRLAARLAAGGGEPLVLFDVGLGAGSNAIAAWRLAEGLPDSARPLDLRWLARLSRSSAAFPADAPADALARISRHPQFAVDM